MVSFSYAVQFTSHRFSPRRADFCRAARTSAYHFPAAHVHLSFMSSSLSLCGGVSLPAHSLQAGGGTLAIVARVRASSCRAVKVASPGCAG